MKRTLTNLVLALLCNLPAFSQVPGNQGHFGIDGDLSSSLNTFTGIGFDDWFKRTTNTGLGVIDTTGASVRAAQLQSGQNVSFSSGMSVPQFSVYNNRLMLDARYARDFYNQDFTTFAGGQKNGDNPSGWSLSLNGGNILDKEDLLEVFAHMRRDGTTINNTNPSDLILAMGASTFGTSGDRYLDFELFRNRIEVNPATSKLANTSTTGGGHSVWTFTNQGALTSLGDMLVSFSFNSTTVSEISVWIWVTKTTYDNVNPTNFDFSKAGGDFIFGPIVGGVTHGYARIVANAGQSFNVNGAVSNNTVRSAPWGSNSKDIPMTSNYYSTLYATGQFAEVSIDLTQLGIDPAINGISTDPCSAPFTRMIVKSRASSSVSSALKDFAGPYVFLDSPLPDAQIATPQTITCASPTVTLSPASFRAGSVYTWTTTNDQILSQTSPNATVSKAGTYTLSVAYVAGCNASSQTVTVAIDTLKPVVTARAEGLVTNNPAVRAQLFGTAARPATDARTSGGYTWSWSGPGNFSAATQNTSTNAEGLYTVSAIEQRNGCRATATALVEKNSVLPIVLMQFGGSIVNEHAELSWTVGDNETGDHFEVQRSTDGRSFAAVALVFTSEKTGLATYKHRDATGGSSFFYRLLIVNKNSTVAYSNVIRLGGQQSTATDLQAHNPVLSTLNISFKAARAGTQVASLYNLAGSKVWTASLQVNKGNNALSLPLNGALAAGGYVLELVSGTERKTTMILKQ